METSDVDLPDERGSNDAFVLPDINDILKRRETEELVAAKKAEEAERNKVKRSDKAAYLKVTVVWQPFDPTTVTTKDCKALRAIPVR